MDSNKNDYTLSVRIPRKMYKELKMKAYEKKMKLPDMMRLLFANYIEEDIAHENIIEKSLITLSGNLQAIMTEQSLYEQLFLAFLNNWFLQHPEPSGKNSLLIKQAVERKNDFLKTFFNTFYSSDQNLFDMLLYMSNESNEKNEDEE